MRLHPSRLLKPAAALLLAACVALTPAVPQAFFFGGVSLKDEKKMGQKFDVLVRSNLPMVEDPEAADYVKGIVSRIVKAIPPQPFEFKSAIILNHSLNAFAVPGGYVYVFTGLLMNFESEDAVAGVLSHEIAHVTQRHVAARIERSQAITLGSLLLAVAGVAVAGPAGGAIATTSMAAGQSAMLGYSRADETEADQIGMQYLIKAGYSPWGLVNGFKVLRSKSMMLGIKVPTYLSTHPDIGDRINGLTARIKMMPASLTGKKTSDTKFHRLQTLLWGRYGDPGQALQRFKGTDALSLMGKAMVLSRQNNVTGAAAAYRQALAKAPSDPLILREAGIFEYRKGDISRARTLLDQAMRLDHRDYMARFFGARLLDDDGRHAEAQQLFLDVLRYVPDDAEVHEALAKSYGASGRQALAYIHMTYSALYAHKKELAERYMDKARSVSLSAPAEFKKLEAIYKERTEIWKKM